MIGGGQPYQDGLIKRFVLAKNFGQKKTSQWEVFYIGSTGGTIVQYYLNPLI